MTLVVDNEVSMRLSPEETVGFFSKVLENKLLEVAQGEFVQIERRAGNKILSEVAQRFTGDTAKFHKQMSGMLQDACEALKDGQTIRIRITD